MRKLSILAAALALSACSATQEQQAVTFSAAACHIATIAESLDPVFVAHNGKVVAGQTLVCAAAPTIIGAIPPTTAATPTP